MQRFPDADPYEVLGLDHRCTPGEVKAAYKKQALKSHPDRAPPEQKEAATARFKIIAEAYETLSDDRKRRDYDMYSPRGRGGAGPSFSTSAFDAAADDFSAADRQHFGTSPDGRPFSFTWESAADSARRAQRWRAGRPFESDPFELFNTMFAREFGSGASMGMGGGSSPFNGFMDDDPFLQNHRKMADFGGFGFGRPAPAAAAAQPPASGMATMLGMPFGGMMGGGGGVPGGSFTSFSSSSSSTSGGGFAHPPGAGTGMFQSTSESRSTRIVNGRQETVIRTTDAQGNETIHHITPEGQTVHVNGIAQPHHPLLGGGGGGGGGFATRAPLPGSPEAPIDVDAL